MLAAPGSLKNQGCPEASYLLGRFPGGFTTLFSLIPLFTALAIGILHRIATLALLLRIQMLPQGIGAALLLVALRFGFGLFGLGLPIVPPDAPGSQKPVAKQFGCTKLVRRGSAHVRRPPPRHLRLAYLQAPRPT